MTISKDSWLFLAIGVLLGAIAAAGYYNYRWHAEEVRLANGRIDANLDLLERMERRDDSARDRLRDELRIQVNALGARDDLTFFQCTNRRRVFERVERLPALTSGDSAEALRTTELLGRFRAGGFACERK